MIKSVFFTLFQINGIKSSISEILNENRRTKRVKARKNKNCYVKKTSDYYVLFSVFFFNCVLKMEPLKYIFKICAVFSSIFSFQ